MNEYKNAMKQFYINKYEAKVSDSFDGGYYVDIYSEGHIVDTKIVYCKYTGEAETYALNKYIKEKHNY